MPLEKELFIKGERGQLEARILDKNPEKIGIICHPHPLYGGNMDNNVVYALKTALEESDYSTVRFNFGGVGRSEGHYGEGVGEVKDLLGVIKYCENEGFKNIVLAGYSFGAWVIVNSSSSTLSRHPLVLVSPPVGIYNFENLRVPKDVKCLIVAGTEDYICPLEKLGKWCAELPWKITLKKVHRCDHFFLGGEGEISKAMKNFLLTPDHI